MISLKFEQFNVRCLYKFQSLKNSLVIRIKITYCVSFYFHDWENSFTDLSEDAWSNQMFKIKYFTDTLEKLWPYISKLI